MDRIVRAVKQVTSRRLYNRPVSRPTNPATRSIFARLSSWTRQPPSPLFGGTAGNFAADPHVWSTGPNSYFMLYTTRQSGVLTIGGAGVGEVDSITGASLFFHPTQPRVYMFYSAVAAGGFPWMTSLAVATY